MATALTDLFEGLIDDAAVFPPGNSPLPQALAGHRAHNDQWYASLVGPLLVPAGSWVELSELVSDESPENTDRPVRVGLISRPGGDVEVLREAELGLREVDGVQVVGAELGWYPRWYDELAGDLPLAIEVPRGEDQDQAIADVRAAQREGYPVVAKFRTGPTPTWQWPDENELAAFLAVVAAADVPFKLTGGLHHALRGRYVPAGGEEEDNHGLLNILAATHAAAIEAPVEDIAAILAERDPSALVHRLRDLKRREIASVRELFTAYGCCTVTDPITELVDHGLLDQKD